MAENPLGLPLQYLKCAKSGKFQRFGQTALTMLRMIYGEIVGTFDAAQKGSYYLYVENRMPTGIWLVCPDNTFSFSTLAAMDATAALETIATYCDSHDIPRWTEFAQWLTTNNSLFADAIALIQSVEIAGLTTSNIPAWTNPQGSISALLRWIKSALVNAETDAGETIPMADLRDALNQNKFVLPISANAGFYGSFSLDTTLQT